MKEHLRNNKPFCQAQSPEENISTEKLLEVAKLVKIRLSNDETKYYANQLAKVVNWVNVIAQVDTNNVPPMRYGNPFQKLISRKDIVNDGNIKDQILYNTKSKYGYFVVPKVI
ncbi:aspartyl/glutamyl-tRNA(Asn/Gln) amidotransferase, C subunit [Candidatus Neoehrlichia lotoris str. RAC413]|uniref:Glutamyl-tRNA(Gln) amidotransferase subunit C n=2 Tax=Candidatus Neoehrlichia procyonis TaxID=467750 RepID=A0A0F3NN62_9RICK|nr:aspartyl/glutamyl-tRNA(Asn/Gln) amidotransferase, C subunit [Candidatus Neoehrlichia lotoris str. RAC413]